ncbi:hypothetical protein [Fredinandcohnia sp. 179-A 10B2 NHS]|uniref:hypothetical protein n=1 Tax=Fredinandcohnia sp. 179-A 10B2 NHS TaxID=3235176 RepID=UPI0039A39897
MKITMDTTLYLRDIDIRKDNKHYIVEDLATQEFFEMPKICIDALGLMKENITLGEIERTLIKEYPNEEVDIIDFTEQLVDLDLIDTINGVKIERSLKNKTKLGFEWIPQKLGKVFFNSYTKYLYAILFISNILIFVWKPSLFPHYTDLFVFDIMSVNILVFGFLTFLMVIIHEFGHILAIRSFNLPTRLEVGRRLYLIVFETDLTLAWKLPSKKRNILYLAGVCFDTVSLFIALMVNLFIPIESEIIIGIVGLIIFDTVVRIIYQCCIYMKTDFYFLFENLSGTYNIMENGIHSIKNLFLKRKSTNKELFAGEEKVVKWYSVFYFIGVAITLALLVIYYLPQLIYMGISMLPGYVKPISDPYFWDAVVFTIQILIIVGFLSHSLYKSYREKVVEN